MPKRPTTPDDKIDALLADVKRQKEAIAEAEKPTYRTNRTFSFTDGDLNRSINLAVVSDVAALLKLAGFVKAQADAYYSVAAALLPGETVPRFTWCGFGADDWMHDIGLRINQVTLKAKKERLARAEERLNSLLSPERRRKLELAAIEAELTSAK